MQRELEQLREQQRMMADLFECIVLREQGEEQVVRKHKRRNPEDIVEHHHCPYKKCARAYSSDSALKRHLKLKHLDLGDDPPQKYHQLHR
jgi:hypothetical protein